MNPARQPRRHDRSDLASARAVLQHAAGEGRGELAATEVAALLNALGLRAAGEAARLPAAVELRIGLERTREFGLVLSAGPGGLDAIAQRHGRRGQDAVHAAAELTDAADVHELSRAEIPMEFKLHQNYPNPFNPATTISFDLPQDAVVNLQIYDVTGRKVRTLADQPFFSGVHQVLWDGCNDSGSQVSSGLYIYRIQVDNYSATRKMVLMR